jgi:hypothetical protein
MEAGQDRDGWNELRFDVGGDPPAKVGPPRRKRDGASIRAGPVRFVHRAGLVQGTSGIASASS